MDDHADFDSVSWPHEPGNETSRSLPFASDPPDTTPPTRTGTGKRSMSDPREPQAGPLADRVDLGGIRADGILECTVDTPLKENDGTKDAYVSYLVTTNVSPRPKRPEMQPKDLTYA